MSNSKPILLRIDISKKYFHSVFLTRSYGTPNGARRCSVVYCYDKTWATLAHSKMSWHCELLATTHIIVIVLLQIVRLSCTAHLIIIFAQLYLEMSQFGAS